MGIKGWNDHDIEMINDKQDIVDIDEADKSLNKAVSKEKLNPKGII